MPRFTLRAILLAVTICAFAALVVGQAAAGGQWAIASTIALGGTAVFFLVYAFFFPLAQLLPLDSRLERAVNGAAPSEEFPNQPACDGARRHE